MGYLRERAIHLVVSNVAIAIVYGAFLAEPELFIDRFGDFKVGANLVFVLVGGANFVAWARFVLAIAEAVETVTSYLSRIDERLNGLRRSLGASSSSSASEAFAAPSAKRKAPDKEFRWPD